MKWCHARAILLTDKAVVEELEMNEIEYSLVKASHAKIDNKKPFTICISPYEVSKNTLAMMDSAVSNLKKGKTSEPIDLSDFVSK